MTLTANLIYRILDLIVKGLSLSDGSAFYPIDYRIYSPDRDGKTKNDHFGDMLLRVKIERGQPAKLKEIAFKVQLFKLIATKGVTPWAITNRLYEVYSHQVQDRLKVRWQIEQLRRELKPLKTVNVVKLVLSAIT